MKKHDCSKIRLPCCNCKQCACTDCPDVLKAMSLPLICDLYTKVSQCSAKKIPAPCSKKCTLPQPQRSRRPSILNVLNDERDCNCGLVARAVRADCFRFLGMRDRHEENNSKKPPSK